MSRDQIFGIARHVLTFVGGLFVVKGYIDESLLNELIGGAIALAGTIWSIADKNKK
jgi:hypothetical protein